MPRLAWMLVLMVACDAPIETDGGVQQPDAGSADGGSTDAGVIGCTSDCVFDPFELLGDPYLPARMLPGRVRLASSREPEPPEAMGNDDLNNFVRVEADGSRVLLEADGPGVITRLWFTGREPAGQVYEVMDQTILHMEIDGAEVVWVDGESGVSLGTLTSGVLPGFARPWVAGRDLASNGLLVHVPIAFAESIRVWIEEPPGIDTLFYYQIDWRELPVETIVESFDGTLDAAQSAAIDAATALWVDRATLAPTQMTADTRTIAPGGTTVRSLDEATTVRAITIEVMTGSLGALEGELSVDGEVSLAGPVARWGFAAPPTVPNDSALTTVGASSLTFRYPFPVDSALELRLTNTTASDVMARMTIEHDPGMPEVDLGALRSSCGSVLTPVMGQNLTLLDLSGVRGHYAGQFLIVRSSLTGFYSGFWVLEGDHEIQADADFILGTGLEDYFGGSFYYLRSPFVLPLSGASYRSDTGTSSMPEVSQYRHHFLDTIPFDGAFRFDYETFLEGSTFEYCLFWYEVR